MAGPPHELLDAPDQRLDLRGDEERRGGIVQRERVRHAAGIYLHCASLAPLLVLAAGQAGCLQLLQDRAHRDVVIKGLGLLLQPAAVQFAEEYAPLVRKLRRFALEGICN